MPEHVEVDPEGRRAPRAPRGLVFVAALVLALGVAVAADTLSGTSTQPPPRNPPADATATALDPTPTSSTTPSIRVETALPAIGGLALGGQRIDPTLTHGDPTAVNSPWAVVVRRADGCLGRYGVVVTYPAHTNDGANTGVPIRVGSATGMTASASASALPSATGSPPAPSTTTPVRTSSPAYTPNAPRTEHLPNSKPCAVTSPSDAPDNQPLTRRVNLRVRGRVVLVGDTGTSDLFPCQAQFPCSALPR